MEPLRTRSNISRRGACLALAAAPLWLTGCLTLPKKDDAKKAPEKPAEPAADAYSADKFRSVGDGRLVLTVSNKVVMAPDTQRAGKQYPGLIARVYLFRGDIFKADNDGKPFTAPGELIVDLFDHTPRPGQTEPKMLERWRFGDGTLDKFARKDRVGNGYTIFLPWSTHSEEISKVLLQARYTAADGRLAVTNQTGVLTVDNSALHEGGPRIGDALGLK